MTPKRYNRLALVSFVLILLVGCGDGTPSEQEVREAILSADRQYINNPCTFVRGEVTDVKLKSIEEYSFPSSVPAPQDSELWMADVEITGTCPAHSAPGMGQRSESEFERDTRYEIRLGPDGSIAARPTQ